MDRAETELEIETTVMTITAKHSDWQNCRQDTLLNNIPVI